MPVFANKEVKPNLWAVKVVCFQPKVDIGLLRVGLLWS